MIFRTPSKSAEAPAPAPISWPTSASDRIAHAVAQRNAVNQATSARTDELRSEIERVERDRNQRIGEIDAGLASSHTIARAGFIADLTSALTPLVREWEASGTRAIAGKIDAVLTAYAAREQHELPPSPTMPITSLVTGDVFVSHAAETAPQVINAFGAPSAVIPGFYEAIAKVENARGSASAMTAAIGVLESVVFTAARGQANTTPHPTHVRRWGVLCIHDHQLAQQFERDLLIENQRQLEATYVAPERAF